jgi:hypothetical protein
MKYSKMSMKKYGELKGTVEARRLAEKKWGCVREPIWKIILRKAKEKNLSPAQLKKLIKPTEHPADVFVKK